ncbi:MAG: GGDEF domain-containing protein [Actinobacteria bacterium]|nr:GGDEF domain-containing protein [Actinomycetota bacterium]
MKYQALHILPLAAAAIATGVALLQASKMGERQPKSHMRFAAAAALFLIAFAAGLAMRDDRVLLVVASLAILALAGGMVQLGKELRVIAEIVAEQRIDFMTKLYNRRTFDERLLAEHSRTKRTGIGYAVAVFEIDNFHNLSEEDRVNGMKLLGKALSESVRHTDTLASIAFHQVAVLMVDTRAEGGVIGAERARERFFFRSCGHDPESNVTRPLTVSVGIAAFDESVAEQSEVVKNAELALNRMRGEGRSGVEVFKRDNRDKRHLEAVA